MTSPFPIEPSPSSKFSYKQRKVETDFGDGYIQRSLDGIKTDQLIWELVWEGLNTEDGDEIDNIFTENYKEMDPITWTDPRGYTKKYIASNFNRVYDKAYNSSVITVTLTEDLNG